MGPYWGWNEVPVDRGMISDPNNWDAIVIKLPASACGAIGSTEDSVNCLSLSAQKRLEDDLALYEERGWMIPGAENVAQNPGSYVVFVREIVDINGQFQKDFYCENWLSPQGRFRVVFIPMNRIGNKDGACYVEHAASSIDFI